MAYETMREPPPVGSVLESIFFVYLLLRDQQELEKTVALAQIQIDPKKAVEAIDGYQKSLFPWTEKQRSEEDQMQKKFLEQEIARGPLTVTPLFQTPLHSRMNAKRISPEQAKARQGLMKKLGSMVPR